MVSHPNRGKGKASATPRPHELKAFREKYGYSEKQAADLVHATETKWLAWESGEQRMHPGLWELAQRKAQEAQDDGTA